jgi:hypothetical protein
MRFNLDDYETVESRLHKFWDDNPNGRIETYVHHYDETRVLIVAQVFAHKDDHKPMAFGHAEEVRDASPVNRTSHVENAETSAIGRALANWKYASKTQPRPSREEMAKVERMSAASTDGDIVAKFREACAKAGLDPQDVAREAGVDMNNLTSQSIPLLRNTFKTMQNAKKPDAAVTEDNFDQQVTKAFSQPAKIQYKEIKDPGAPATSPQKGKLRAMLNGTGRQGAAAHTEAVAEIVNRPIRNLDELTKAEADRAIKVLDERTNDR